MELFSGVCLGIIFGDSLYFGVISGINFEE